MASIIREFFIAGRVRRTNVTLSSGPMCLVLEIVMMRFPVVLGAGGMALARTLLRPSSTTGTIPQPIGPTRRLMRTTISGSESTFRSNGGGFISRAFWPRDGIDARPCASRSLCELLRRALCSRVRVLARWFSP